jgi:hypothetical protein
MLIRKLFLSCLALFLMAGISQAAGQWVHVHVDNPAKSEKVKINIPVSLMETMLPLIEEKGVQKGKIKLEDKELKVEDLRKMWNELRKQGDAEFLSVEDKDTSVRVYTEGNFLMVQPEKASKEKVKIKVPLSVVDALLSGHGDELNLTAAVKALKDSGVRDIISVQDDENIVRVWIDENNKVQ